MKDNSIQKQQKLFLLLAATFLIPVALCYGLAPQKTLTPYLGIAIDNTNLTHVLRAVMGLYLGQIVFWYLGAFYIKLRRAALYSLIVFMFGLAGGRLLSLLLDGIPHWILIASLVIEFGAGCIGYVLLKKGG